MTLRRVVVLGHTGLIGAAVMAELARIAPALDVQGASLGAVDLADPASAARLAPLLQPDTSVVLCAAIKRQLGDSPDIYLRNTQILATMASLLSRYPVGRLVYLSSAAVYGEDVENLAITEDTPLVARTYYGLSKITGEWILSKIVEEGAAASLGLVRPAMIYGPGDQTTSYGPSSFLDATVTGRPISLWGDGRELREMIYVDDAARIIAAYALMSHSGPLNIASGISYSFTDAVEAAAEIVGVRTPVSSKDRSKPKVDNRFDASRLKAMMPDLGFTPLAEGMRRTFRQRYGARAEQPGL